MFEPNLGQAPANAKYVAQARAFRLLLERNAAVFDFGQTQARLEFTGSSAWRPFVAKLSQACWNLLEATDGAIYICTSSSEMDTGVESGGKGKRLCLA